MVGEDRFWSPVIGWLGQARRLLSYPEGLAPVHQPDVFLGLIEPLSPFRPPHEVLWESWLDRLAVFSDEILDDWSPDDPQYFLL